MASLPPLLCLFVAAAHLAGARGEAPHDPSPDPQAWHAAAPRERTKGPPLPQTWVPLRQPGSGVKGRRGYGSLGPTTGSGERREETSLFSYLLKERQGNSEYPYEL